MTIKESNKPSSISGRAKSKASASIKRKPTVKKRKPQKSLVSPKLTVELVPRTSWFSNVRDHVSQSDWDKLRRAIYQKANYLCEVCGGRGEKWPVECHEIWLYDDKNHEQKLSGLIALCPSCHEVKHIGLAGVRGRADIAEAHLIKVNGWTRKQAEEYLEKVKAVWRKRSLYDWEIDFTWLEEQFGIRIESKTQKQDL